MTHVPEVVNVKKAMLVKKGYRDLVHWLEDPNHVYVGRDMTRYVPGAVGSKWGNPFTQKHGDLATRIRDYEEYIRKQGYDFMELSGKSVGCWCAPEPCHGEVLLRLVREEEAARGIAPAAKPEAQEVIDVDALSDDAAGAAKAPATKAPATKKAGGKKKRRLQ